MNPQTLIELRNRLKINEGVRLARYLDTKGIPTIATGYNLQARGTAGLAAVGVVDPEAVATGADSQRPGVARLSLAALRTAFPGTHWAPANAAQTFIAGITPAQNDAMLDNDIPSFVGSAASSLPAGLFDAMTVARQVAWTDMAFNMGIGSDGLGGFRLTIALLIQAQRAKDAGRDLAARTRFEQVGDHIQSSAFFGQVGDRAKRDVAMMRTGVLVDPSGDGSV